MKRVSTRAIIFIDDKIALIYRNKHGNIYYSLPGGGVEANKTLEQTTIREVKEEINLDVEVLGYLGTFEDDTSIQHFYHCNNIGKIDLKIIGEEKDRNSKENYYEPMLVEISNIDNLDIRFKDIIKKAIKKEYL